MHAYEHACLTGIRVPSLRSGVDIPGAANEPLLSSNQGLGRGMTYAIFPNSIGGFHLGLKAAGA